MKTKTSKAIGKIGLDVDTFVDSILTKGMVVKPKHIKKVKTYLSEAILASAASEESERIVNEMYVLKTVHDDLLKSYDELKSQYETLVNKRSFLHRLFK